jgi:hypothetical protein
LGENPAEALKHLLVDVDPFLFSGYHGQSSFGGHLAGLGGGGLQTTELGFGDWESLGYGR